MQRCVIQVLRNTRIWHVGQTHTAWQKLPLSSYAFKYLANTKTITVASTQIDIVMPFYQAAARLYNFLDTAQAAWGKGSATNCLKFSKFLPRASDQGKPIAIWSNLLKIMAKAIYSDSRSSETKSSKSRVSSHVHPVLNVCYLCVQAWTRGSQFRICVTQTNQTILQAFRAFQVFQTFKNSKNPNHPTRPCFSSVISKELLHDNLARF